MRYGSDLKNLMSESTEHETWSLEQWKSWEEGQLARLLHHSAIQVPYYRELWAERRKNGDQASWKELQNWPVLHKEALRAKPYSFLADNYNTHRLWEEHTSGTTGMPLTIRMSKSAVRQWYALCELRWRGWYGLSRHDRWGIFGGQMVTPFTRKKPPFWVWNLGLNQLYLSSYHISPQNAATYIKAFRKHQLTYLLGYASSLFSLAQLSLEQKLDIPVLKAVVSNAEPLYEHQREIISKAFQCPVYDTYGLSENVCAASECLHGNLHLWPEVGVTEILDDDKDIPVSKGETGRLVCTGFLNPAMPLIRYDVGDRGFLLHDVKCACGRKLPVLGGIEGRADDVIQTSDGRRIGRLDPVFKNDIRIREAQIIQESLNLITVKYVPASGCSNEDLEILADRIRDRLGDIKITFYSHKQIPRSSNGKFKAVVSNLN
jgi:phenylacetate-CoA ligase